MCYEINRQHSTETERQRDTETETDRERNKTNCFRNTPNNKKETVQEKTKLVLQLPLTVRNVSRAVDSAGGPQQAMTRWPTAKDKPRLNQTAKQTTERKQVPAGVS